MRLEEELNDQFKEVRHPYSNPTAQPDTEPEPELNSRRCATGTLALTRLLLATSRLIRAPLTSAQVSIKLALAATAIVILGLVYWFYILPMKANEDTKEL